jgi:hypothetical protein
MDEELDQIEKNDTWELVPRPKKKNVIGTKWVFRNKLNEDGQVTRNKARLVCKGYAQIEGIDLMLDTPTTLRGGVNECGVLFPKTSLLHKNSSISIQHLFITHCCHL